MSKYQIYFMVNRIKIQQLFMCRDYVTNSEIAQLNRFFYSLLCARFSSFGANPAPSPHKIEIVLLFLPPQYFWRVEPHELYFFLSKDKSARVPYVGLILENVFRFLACNRWLGGTVHPPLEGSGNPMRVILFLQHILSSHELTIFIFYGIKIH